MAQWMAEMGRQLPSNATHWRRHEFKKDVIEEGLIKTKRIERESQEDPSEGWERGKEEEEEEEEEESLVEMDGLERQDGWTNGMASDNRRIKGATNVEGVTAHNEGDPAISERAPAIDEGASLSEPVEYRGDISDQSALVFIALSAEQREGGSGDAEMESSENAATTAAATAAAAFFLIQCI